MPRYTYTSNTSGAGAIAAILIWLAVVGVSIGGWFTHVVHCIQNEQWLFLIGGAICAPIGVIHGVGLWFGWF